MLSRSQPPPPRRSRPWLWFAGGLGLLVLGVAAAEWAGWPFLRGPLQQRLQQTLRAPVTLQAPFRLQLLVRPQLVVGGMQLGAPPGLGVDRLLDAEALQLRWRWQDLLWHKPATPWQLLEVSARRLDLNLLRMADGRTSWPVGLWPGPQAVPAVRKSLPVSVALLQLERGNIVYRDALTDSDMQVQVQGRQAQGAALSTGPRAADAGATALAGFSATVQGRWRRSPLQLSATAGAATTLLESGPLGQNLVMVPVTLQGRIGAADLNFHGAAADLLSARALRGSLLLRGPSLAAVGDAVGVTLPTTPPFRMVAALSHDAGLWTLLTQEVQVGGSRLQADLRFDTRPAKPLLTGSLGGQLLRLKDLGPAIGTAAPADTPVLPGVLDAGSDPAQGDVKRPSLPGGPAASPVASAAAIPASSPTPGPASAARAGKGAAADRSGRPAAPALAARSVQPVNPPPKRAGRVLPDRSFDLRSLHAMDADVQVAIRTLDLGDDAAIAPLRALSTHLTLRQGLLRLDDLRALAAGGHVSGNTSFDAARDSTVARWQADLRLTNMQLDQWLRGLQRKGTPLLSGRLMARLQVKGVGGSTAALLSSMDGQIGANLRQGKVSHLMLELAGLDLAQALGVMLQGDKPLVLNCALLQSVVSRGVMRIRDAVLDTDDSTLNFTGQLNLGDETLALRGEVKPKDFSPFSLRSPILVGGTLAAPEVGVETGRLVGRAVAALALGAAAPVAALLPFLEFGGEPGALDQPCTGPARGRAPGKRAGGASAPLAR